MSSSIRPVLTPVVRQGNEFFAMPIFTIHKDNSYLSGLDTTCEADMKFGIVAKAIEKTDQKDRFGNAVSKVSACDILSGEFISTARASYRAP